MEQLSILSKAPLSLPKLGILTQVLELTRYDYIYIKSKLYSGLELSIIEDNRRTWDKAALAVYYKGYKLGYLSQNINQTIKNNLARGNLLKIVVRELNKNKIQQLRGIDVLITIF